MKTFGLLNVSFKALITILQVQGPIFYKKENGKICLTTRSFFFFFLPFIKISPLCSLKKTNNFSFSDMF